MVIDDPVKDAADANSEAAREKSWEWWTKVAQTRLTRESIVIIILTRWHDEDLAGKILKQEKKEPGTYRIKLVRIPAIAESDETRAEMQNVLDLPEAEDGDPLGRSEGEALCDEIAKTGELKAVQKSDREGFACLYQGAPRPEGGLLLGRAAFKRLPVPPEEGTIRWVIPSDWAITEKQTAPKRRNDPDYTVFGLLGLWQKDVDDPLNVRLVLAGLKRGQWESTDTKTEARKFMLKVEQKLGIRVPFVAGQDNIDKVALNDLRVHPKLLLWAIENLGRDKLKGDKVVKSAGWRSRATNDMFYVVDDAWWGEKWNEAFFSEVEGFPRATHDDMVDMVSVGAAYLTDEEQGGETLPFSLLDVTADGWQQFIRQRRVQFQPEPPTIENELSKYVKYIKNAGGNVSIDDFNDDWYPVGQPIRDKLKEEDLIVEFKGGIYLTEDKATPHLIQNQLDW